MSIKWSIQLVLLLTFSQLQAQESTAFTVPVAGNSWAINKTSKATGKLGKNGWESWTDSSVYWTTYFRVGKAGSLRLKVLAGGTDGKSRLLFAIGDKSQSVEIHEGGARWYEVGEWKLASAGYVKLVTSGLEKAGRTFAAVQSFQISGTAVDSATAFVPNDEGNFYYWGRRGPSVHINYQTDSTKKIEWFYNEIVVPANMDPVGSYFMADGFAEGYFGMQVNSPTERRIIFSVWSLFKTDNPKEIPDSQKIRLLKSGPGVQAGEFGNEGSGGHSHLVYHWKAGDTCKFLLHATPAPGNYTNYTAYFFDKSSAQWLLIASFSRPFTQTWLKRLHSFLESFEPETGNITRKAYYQNQWVKPVGEGWMPINTMSLTADATARKRFRMDYNGGVENGTFFLQNAGFFNDTATLKKTFSINAGKYPPDIDFNALVHAKTQK